MALTRTSVALCQTVCLDGDRAGNLARIEGAAAEAKARGARIACFPETALYGWVNPEAHERADAIPGRDSDALCAIARKHALHVCCGLAEKDGETLYDSAILIGSQGDILLKHRKLNVLAHLLEPPYAAGTDIRAVDTPFGRIGVLICADTFVDEHLARMAALRPDLLLAPYGWAEAEAAWPDHGKKLEQVVCNAAKTIGAPVVGVDCVGVISHGPWRGRVYGGQSVACTAAGRILGRGADRDRDVVVVAIETAPRG